MDLDDQLSALAAGELGADEERALRARAVADPAVALALARHERLHALLTGWEVAPMTDSQRGALDDAVTQALDALDDAPLVAHGGAEVVGLRPRPDDRERDGAAARTGAVTSAGGSVRDPSAGERGTVVDLGTERRRRALPGWVAGLAAAAAGVAVVGSIGAGLSGLGAGDTDAADDDVMVAADAAADDGGDEAETEALEGADDSMAVEEDAAADVAEGADAADDTAVGDDVADGDEEATSEAGGRGVVAPLVVDDVGSLDAATLGTVADQVPGPLVTEGVEALAARATTAPDVLAEEAARVADVVLGALAPSPCLADAVATATIDGVLLLAGYGTYEGEAAVVTVTVRSGAGDGTDGGVVATTVIELDSCLPVAEESRPAG